MGVASYPIASVSSTLAPFGAMLPDTRIDSYHLLNLRVAYRFWKEKTADGSHREAELAISVFNALNDTHREHSLGDLLGTRVLGWLPLKL
ncbi:MAG: hypothetical protein JSS38_01475 [Nitrospira sp.]|nr:hypothetical protein [Nitrospira sp.]